MVAFGGCSFQQDAKQASNTDTVGMVNMQVVMEHNPDMASAQTKMKSEYDKIRNDIKDTEGLPPEQRQSKVMDAQKKLQDLEKQTMSPIQDNVNKSIDEVMKDKKLSAVIDKRVIVRGGTDITKDVLIKEGLTPEDAQKAIDSEDSHVNDNN